MIKQIMRFIVSYLMGHRAVAVPYNGSYQPVVMDRKDKWVYLGVTQGTKESAMKYANSMLAQDRRIK